MKKFLTISAILIVGIVIVFQAVNEKKPVGIANEQAEILTDKMFRALNKSAWDTLPIISWTSREFRYYLWDRKNKRTLVQWDNYRAFINLENQEISVLENGIPVHSEEVESLSSEVWKYWCNDSFWLVAPFKARDFGTSRKIINLDDGYDGLMIEYHTGGVTPGDTYLWALDSEGIPQYFKMWVSILPIGGLKVTWKDWKDCNGALISQKHKIGPVKIRFDNIKYGLNLSDLGIEEDPFN